MARTTRPLTNTEVLRAKAVDKDMTLHDGEGLFFGYQNQWQKALAFSLSTSSHKAKDNDRSWILPRPFTC